jgi:nucleoside-diphosphate-sugar epimerase
VRISSDRRPVALVTGATGAVGPALVAGLRQTGHQVRVYSRHASRHDWPPDVRAYDGDILDPDLLRSAADGVDAIFHLASLLHVVDAAPALASEYARINIEGTRAVARAARACGAGRIVLFSTIAVYGATRGHEVDERTAVSPETDYARSKLAAESELLAAEPDRSTILRVAAVYGPRLKGNYLRLVRSMSRRRFVPLGRGENRRTIVFDRDVADAAIAVVDACAARGRIYNVTDGHVHRMRDIIDAVSAALGQEPPRRYVPAQPARLLASLLDRSASLVGLRPPVNTATIDKYLEDVAVSGIRITADTGWSPQIDLRDGWRQTVRGMRESGTL